MVQPQQAKSPRIWPTMCCGQSKTLGSVLWTFLAEPNALFRLFSFTTATSCFSRSEAWRVDLEFIQINQEIFIRYNRTTKQPLILRPTGSGVCHVPVAGSNLPSKQARGSTWWNPLSCHILKDDMTQHISLDNLVYHFKHEPDCAKLSPLRTRQSATVSLV